MVEFEAPVNSPQRQHPNPILKLVLEVGPLVAFFFANARGEWLAEKLPFLASLGDPANPDSINLFVATAVFMAATALSVAISLAATRRLPIMPFVSLIVVLIFGGLTLALQNETFIKMKPTIINSLFGGILLGGLLFNKSFIGYVLDSVFQMTDEGWRKLTFRWGVFFFVLAILNELVWRISSATMDAGAANDLWVNFKVFAIMPLTLLFTFSQLPLIMREQAKVDAEQGAPAE